MTAVDLTRATPTNRLSTARTVTVADEGLRPERAPVSDAGWTVGDVVRCPSLGVGTICGRSDRDIDGARVDCVVIAFAAAPRERVVPVADARACGLRCPASVEELDDALVALTCEPASAVPRWTERLKINGCKLARGTVSEAAEVARDLAWLRSGRRLGLSERAWYEAAHAILACELAFAFALDAAHAARRIEQLLTWARPAGMAVALSLESDRR